MPTQHYLNFKYKVLLAEQEEPTNAPEQPTDVPEAPPTEEIESDLEKILSDSKKVTFTLVKLLSTYDKVSDKAKDELRELINDIRCISYKPTTFRVVLSNDNYFDLRYEPTPMQLKYPKDYDPSDMFNVDILGKRYSLVNKSEYEQALDYIQKIQREKPVLIKEPGEGEPGGPAGGPTAAKPGEKETPPAEQPK